MSHNNGQTPDRWQANDEGPEAAINLRKIIVIAFLTDPKPGDSDSCD
jgi:hypothetical protein